MLWNPDREPPLCTSNMISGIGVFAAVSTCAGEVSVMFVYHLPWSSSELPGGHLVVSSMYRAQVLEIS